jgi:hypothetical protein
MVHIAKDCQAAGILTSKDYHASLKTNLARSGVSASGVDVDYISGLPWIVTEDFVDTISDEPFFELRRFCFSSTRRVDDGAQGRDRDARKHPGYLPLVIDHPEPVVVSWLPQYHDMGLIGCYLYPALKGGTTYGFAPWTSFSARSCGSTRSRPIGPPRRPRPTSPTTIACAPEAFQGESGRLRPQLAPVLMCAAEPVKPDTTPGF